jgi:hypothetical protein
MKLFLMELSERCSLQKQSIHIQKTETRLLTAVISISEETLAVVVRSL